VRIRPKQHNFCRIQVSSELTIFAGKMEEEERRSKNPEGASSQRRFNS